MENVIIIYYKHELIKKKPKKLEKICHFFSSPLNTVHYILFHILSILSDPHNKLVGQLTPTNLY